VTTQIVNIIGSIAACLTTTAFFPQVIMTIKTKNTGGISAIMYIMFCIGLLLWTIYGIALHAIPLIASNAITLLLALIILIYKLKYG
jgi:MtN3 and saliva related transmembrane protein